MSNKILFVFEGERREPKVANSLQMHVFKDKPVVTCSFNAEIYQLYRQLSQDEYLDIFSLMKERDANLAQYSKDNFSEIYLFFDYDAHASIGDGDRVLREMLALFDNETENGKLYVSYPMVEALWHIEDYDSFHELTVKCKGKNCSYHDKENTECTKCNDEPRYRQIVGKYCIKQLVNIHQYDTSVWNNLIKAHLCKMNYIISGDNSFPQSIFSQSEIFSSQLEKYVNKRCPTVAVLSAFPVFVHDYYGNNKLQEILQNL